MTGIFCIFVARKFRRTLQKDVMSRKVPKKRTFFTRFFDPYIDNNYLTKGFFFNLYVKKVHFLGTSMSIPSFRKFLRNFAN